MLAEALLSAATEAIFSYLIEQSGVADKGRKLFKRPTGPQVALETALARAYAKFLKSPYNWAASALFDEQFIREQVAPLLSRCLQRDKGPDAAELAKAWADQFSMRGQTREKQILELQPAADEFLKLLSSELRTSDILRPILDSQDLATAVRYLDGIAQSTAQTQASIVSLTQEMKQAVAEVQKQYYRIYIDHASGSAIGDQATVVNVTINGSILLEQFDKAHPQLLTHIRSAKTYIAKRTEDFVGRSFIFDKIDALLTQRDKFPSGYLTISGEPGIGKTALCGELVNRLGCVYHFNIANQGVTSAKAFLENVCAQLIVRYGLDEKYTFALESRGFEDSELLSELLTVVSSRHRDEPIIVVVDALDEAEYIPGLRRSNPLFLPEHLPEGVFFIVSRRPVAEEEDALQIEQLYKLEIAKDDPRNLEDIRHYIEHFVSKNREVMAVKIAEWHISEKVFVQAIYERGDGNFMYARSVLWDIHAGILTYENLGSIEHLPRGLKEYYRRHRDMMRRRDPLFNDLVCILATFESPLSVPEASAMVGHDEIKVRQSFELWRSVLNVTFDANGSARYSLYHRSFQEYLDKVEDCTSRWRKKMREDMEALFGDPL